MIVWVPGTTVYDKADPSTFIAVDSEGHNLFVRGVLRGTFGSLSDAKTAAVS